VEAATPGASKEEAETHELKEDAMNRFKLSRRFLCLTAARNETEDADGTRRGHTIFSYHRKDGTSSNSSIAVTSWNHETFFPVFEGGWNTTDNPIVNYLWSPVENPSGPYNASQTTASWDMNAGNPFTYSAFAPFTQVSWHGGATTPLTKTYTYTATDSQGATATAKYILTLHDPWEIVTKTSAPAKRNYRPHPYGSWVDASHDGDTLVGQLTQTYGWDVGVTFSGPDDLIANLIGVDVTVTRTVSTGVTVGNEHNNVRKGYRACIMIWDAVIRHTGTANQWDEEGYVGNMPFECDEPDNPAGGMHLGPVEWNGDGPEPPEGPFIPED
jgi:hypothetical protein